MERFFKNGRRVALRAALSGLLGSLLLVACGGGGGDSPVASGAAANTAVGPISGFGSIIVNGVRYDDSAAVITDDDDNASGRDALKLGMMVEVKSGPVANGTAQALSIAFGGWSLVGPAGSVTPAADGTGTMTVIGQKVAVTATTVFDDGLTGLAGIAAGDIVNVHGLFDAATETTTATRIERKPNAREFRLHGKIASTGDKTITIGTETIDYSTTPANRLPRSPLAAGQVVRARVQTVKNAAGAWVANRIKTARPELADGNEAELKGFITAVPDPATPRVFEINGLKVDATNAVIEGNPAALIVGALVEVKGSIRDGVLIATKVELEDHERDRGDAFELHGAVAELSTADKTFMLRGLKISYAGTVTYKDGTEADLANGKRVEVKGKLSADKTMIEASSIEFENR
jgi:hypothetical protein